MPDHRYSAKTQSQHETYLAKIRKRSLGKMAVADIEVAHVAESLDELTSGRRMRNVYRQLLIQVFQCAIELGWAPIIPRLSHAPSMKTEGGCD
ncbi:hypothetical protein HKX42_03935 [Salinisphaera sp. USBA-960]|uniref:hypothetical protein n=1 Tax=Salinisphaera orenii TaxID=856731 RepID=UPI000DBE4F47|nr:hypothetical protein [Salifodinibacter halophilus]NNC26025.1 hypothetical protein [Salifodinibacter halophilus]